MKYFSVYVLACKVLLTALFAFTIYRLCFIFFNSDSIPVNPDHAVFLYARSMLFGINFDLVICCYVLAPFIVFCFLQQFFQRLYINGYIFFKWYFIVLFSCCLFICVVDIPYFKQFGSHLNQSVFTWNSSPLFVFKLIFSSFSYWGFLFLFFALSFFMYWRISGLFSFLFKKHKTSNKFLSVAAFMIMASFTFIGIRGRTTLKTPIQTGTAFFSEYAFFNQLGLNPCFVFFSSLKHEQEWPFLTAAYSEKDLFHALEAITSSPKRSIHNKVERAYLFDTIPQKYNVMLVLMESMSMTKMGYYNCTHLTSRFDSLVKQGVFFNRFYSSGIHTFNGLFSTETGFPAIMDTHPLNKYVNKSFKGISYWLKQNGYSNYFFTCHDGQFDNMEGFMKFNYFDDFYSQDDYPAEKAISTLGVPDHYLFDYALDKMDEHMHKKNAPFFSYILTSSDHGPWKTPSDIVFKPTASDERDRAAQYADWSLGYFIDKAKQYDWFKNTLFVFVGDHGVNFGHTYAMPLSYHHIPCLFYMPSQLRPDTVSSLGGQIDVFPTIMSVLKIPFTNTSMGIDLMHEKRPWMYFTADSKIGVINDTFYYFHLLEDQKEFLYRYENLSPTNLLSTCKTKVDSMKKYGYQMIRTANYIIKHQLY